MDVPDRAAVEKHRDLGELVVGHQLGDGIDRRARQAEHHLVAHDVRHRGVAGVGGEAVGVERRGDGGCGHELLALAANSLRVYRRPRRRPPRYSDACGSRRSGAARPARSPSARRAAAPRQRLADAGARPVDLPIAAALLVVARGRDRLLDLGGHGVDLLGSAGAAQGSVQPGQDVGGEPAAGLAQGGAGLAAALLESALRREQLGVLAPVGLEDLHAVADQLRVLPGEAELAAAHRPDEAVDAGLEALLGLAGETAEEIGKDGPRLRVHAPHPSRQVMMVGRGWIDRARGVRQPLRADDSRQLRRRWASTDGDPATKGRCDSARALGRDAAAVRLRAGGGGRCLGCVDHSARSQSIGTRESYPTLRRSASGER